MVPDFKVSDEIHANGACAQLKLINRCMKIRCNLQKNRLITFKFNKMLASLPKGRRKRKPSPEKLMNRKG